MIGTRLNELLKERGLRIADLARLTDIPVQTLYSIVRRDSMQIDIDYLMQICHALTIQPQAFASPEVAQQLDQRMGDLSVRFAQLSAVGKDMLLQRADELIQLGYTVAKNAESA